MLYCNCYSTSLQSLCKKTITRVSTVSSESWMLFDATFSCLFPGKPCLRSSLVDVWLYLLHKLYLEGLPLYQIFAPYTDIAQSGGQQQELLCHGQSRTSELASPPLRVSSCFILSVGTIRMILILSLAAWGYRTTRAGDWVRALNLCRNFGS